MKIVKSKKILTGHTKKVQKERQKTKIKRGGEVISAEMMTLHNENSDSLFDPISVDTFFSLFVETIIFAGFARNIVL